MEQKENENKQKILEIQQLLLKTKTQEECAERAIALNLLDKYDFTKKF